MPKKTFCRLLAVDRHLLECREKVGNSQIQTIYGHGSTQSKDCKDLQIKAMKIDFRPNQTREKGDFRQRRNRHQSAVIVIELKNTRARRAHAQEESRASHWATAP
ncbi:hypothetical protein [Puniceicoccus vermicola]|uniref:Uncharacterized protein n=1 Tax=Puniceicoccus vermicola TaxID=388746 RepID=A0A7X1B1L4_9BACT|nr:hypothetical protein [Puniceicoccus vermicola]MBC2602848.1 hypothetical protein [Puniceicoccus vermicola]